MTTRQIPSEEQVIDWIDTLSNWGRWGDDDQLGTVNLITDAKRARRPRWCARASASPARGS